METVRELRRVLLLSTGTGEGHNACARAMAEYLLSRGVEAEVRDGLAFVSRGYARFLSGGHTLVYRFLPRGFDWGWRYCERHPRMFEPGSHNHRKLSSGVERLYRAVVDGGYDAVISTHGLTAVMLTEMQRRYDLPIRTAFIATDHASYPCMHVTDLDAYLVPDDTLIEVYAQAGIPKEHILVGGIPLRRGFSLAPEHVEARRVLGMDEHGRHMLVMSGSMGCGHMQRIVSRVLKSAPAGASIGITVICGRNKSLCRRLSRRYRSEGRVHILGYCDRVPLYMAASDVFLTKPGGISTAEAHALARPMVLVNTVAGCEQYNLDYYLRTGGALTAQKTDALAELCLSVLTDDARREGMVAALRDAMPADGAALLWETLAAGERQTAAHGGVV